jgi:predicted transcriptional regulator of viral defense system
MKKFKNTNNKKNNEVKALIVTSSEVLKILGISRTRLCQLNNDEKLVPIKKGIYLLSDVLKRKEQQSELRKKYYKRSD